MNKFYPTTSTRTENKIAWHFCEIFLHKKSSKINTLSVLFYSVIKIIRFATGVNWKRGHIKTDGQTTSNGNGWSCIINPKKGDLGVAARLRFHYSSALTKKPPQMYHSSRFFLVRGVKSRCDIRYIRDLANKDRNQPDANGLMLQTTPI